MMSGMVSQATSLQEDKRLNCKVNTDRKTVTTVLENGLIKTKKKGKAKLTIGVSGEYCIEFKEDYYEKSFTKINLFYVILVICNRY